MAHIRGLIAWARQENIPIFSTAVACRDKSPDAAFGQCIDHFEWQTRTADTLRYNPAILPADDNSFLPPNLLRRHKQIILHKRCIDPFDEPRLERLLSEAHADEFLLIGANTENAITATALGLLQRGKNVRVVVDAIGSNNNREAELALRKMQAKGAKMIVTEKLLAVSHLR
jgi:nicotinamidase-related amidase